jgi:hypothetical protein
MLKNQLLTFFALSLSTCATKKNLSQTLDFGSFRIEAPKSWKKLDVQGVDSYVGRIALETTDTLEFDLGRYSDNLVEFDSMKVNGKTFFYSTSDTAYEPEIVDSTRLNKVKKSSVTWQVINGRKAKVLQPIQSGIGITGIYIDSLWSIGSDKIEFNLYGVNLKPQNEKATLLAFRTLRFIKPEENSR